MGFSLLGAPRLDLSEENFVGFYWRRREVCSLRQSKNRENLLEYDIDSDLSAGYCTVKKVSGFPVPILDVTNQTLPGRENR
jgi:hypothetical protein